MRDSLATATDSLPAADTRAWWRDRRFLVLLALGFSAGVPLPLAAGLTLRQWLSESDISLTAIGLTALTGLAYSFKFLWSPLLDHAAPPRPFRALGRRRGWLATIQPVLILAILGMGLTDPASDLTWTMALACIVAFLSASQDIVIDAWRIEVLDERAQGYGLACYVWGYRAALLASGAGALKLATLGGWAVAFASCAAMIAVGFVAVLLAPEPHAAQVPAASWAARLRAAVIDPFADFMRRRHWLAILLFVALFKLGEALAGIMTTPFYRSLGFSRDQVAEIGSIFGLAATLVGALAGGWLVARIGTGRALVLTGLTQMLSNLMYVALAHAGYNVPMLWAQVGVENFTDGLADAAFLTYLSALTGRAFTATQYALLSSLAAVPLRTLGASSGWLAERLGWADFFLLTTFAALPAMAIMLWLLARLPPEERHRVAAEEARPT